MDSRFFFVNAKCAGILNGYTRIINIIQNKIKKKREKKIHRNNIEK